MRRALAVILLLIFAATSESAALCLESPQAAGVRASHACCPERTASTSLGACCTNAPATAILAPRSTCVDTSALALTDYLLLSPTADIVKVPTWRVKPAVNVSSPPLYLQHLALLI